ncbi:MAG: transcriptional repressor, partial [Geodermatophilaceae bacterium]|nr:transcriptional repressor [Geodermatophilaceae bacterium]
MSTPLRTTRQRTAVSALLGDLEEFRSAQHIHQLLRAQGDTVGLSTVYRTLQAMADAGELDVIK